jgi:translation initiation factor IF-3
LIDEKGEQVGVIDRRDAQRMAETAGLDLVEIKPELDPPLCKIMDFGKYKYELGKKKSAQTKASKTNEPKDLRLGRGATIDAADLERRIEQAREFLMEGHPVNFIQRFRGREMAHPEIGRDRLEAVRKRLEDISKMQTEPKLAGRQMNMLLVPDKARISALKERTKHKPGAGS